MEGHLIQRGKRGTWYVYFDLPRQRGEKRKQQGIKIGTMPKNHALAKMREVLKKVDDGTYRPERRDITVEQVIKTWLEDVKSDLATTTIVRYTYLMKHHVIPRIGNRQASKVTPTEILEVYRAVEDAGLSKQTRLHVHRALHTAFAHGVRVQQVLAENVVSRLKPPRVERRINASISHDRVRKIIETAKGTRLAVPITVAALTGLRRGEVLALTWDHVDLDRGSLYVGQSLEHTRVHGVRFKSPKSATSRRVIPLAAEAVEILRTHKEEQDSAKEAAGSAYRDLGLVFPNPDGTPWPPDSFSVQFGKVASKAECKGFRLHDLRHSFATLTLAGGASIRDVSDLLGHSQKGFTVQTYAHSMPATGRAVVTTLAQALLTRPEVAESR